MEKVTEFLNCSHDINISEIGDPANSADELEKFIDTKFEDIINKNIKSMLKSEFPSLFCEKPEVKKELLEGEHICNINDRLVEQLKSEIMFLRNEILSKNKIIEVLITDNKKVNNVIS